MATRQTKTFKDIHIGQCFRLPGLPSTIWKKVATDLLPIVDKPEDGGMIYNSIVTKARRGEEPVLNVGYKSRIAWNEVVKPCKNPETARQERNAANRLRNQMLRDLCGTSARAARADMGL